MISGVCCAAAEEKVPACATPARSSARIVSSTPVCPWSREWVPAVEQARHPVWAIAVASAGGVLKVG